MVSPHVALDLPGVARASSPGSLRLRCGDVHPVGCEVVLAASSLEVLIARAREHGARAHGFTPVWYSPRRVASMVVAANE